jgi:hypothetical protein
MYDILTISEKFTENLGTFFEDNYKLFTLIGVFGAVSLYLKRNPQPVTPDGLFADFIFVTSLSIATLIMFILLIRSFTTVAESDSGLFSVDNFLFLPFWTLFYMLAGSLASFLSSFPDIWGIYGSIVLFMIPVGSFVVLMKIFERVANRISENFRLSTVAVHAVLFFVTTLATLVIGSTLISTVNLGEQAFAGGLSFRNAIDFSIFSFFIVWGGSSLLLASMTALLTFFRFTIQLLRAVNNRCGLLLEKFDNS